MNPFIINDDNAKAGFCIIKKFLNAFDSCKEICNTCIYFFVNEFKDGKGLYYIFNSIINIDITMGE